jgi:Fur family peroxide stress response transcriptional regulator
MPALSLATVYKALDALLELGVAREVSVAGGTKRYDANLERHHHLVCTSCGHVSDYYSEALDALEPPRRIGGFLPESLSVQVLGVCADCSTQQKRN